MSSKWHTECPFCNGWGTVLDPDAVCLYCQDTGRDVISWCELGVNEDG